MVAVVSGAVLVSSGAPPLWSAAEAAAVAGLTTRWTVDCQRPSLRNPQPTLVIVPDTV